MPLDPKPACLTMLGLSMILAPGYGEVRDDAAQRAEIAKARCFGKAWTSGGQPWSRAEVLFEPCLPPESEDWRPGKPTVTTTDEKGRFRVRLRPGRRYLVYARSPLSGVRASRMSAAVWFEPRNRYLSLREEGRPGPHIDLHVHGLAAFLEEWQELRPLRYRIVSTSGLVRPLDLSEDEPVALPAWPDDRAEVQILDKRGCVLYRHDFPLGEEDRSFRKEDLAVRRKQQTRPRSRFLPGLEGKDFLAGTDVEWMILPPSRTLEIRLTDKSNGKELSEAEVVEYARSRFAGRPRSFVTDARGRVLVRVPHRIFAWGQYREPSIFDFLARVPGYEHYLAHFEFRSRRARVNFRFDDLFSEEAPSVLCKLDKGLKYVGRLVLPLGLDASSLRMRTWSSGPLSRSDDWIGFVRQPSMRIRPDKAGRFEMGGLGSDPESIRIDMLLPAALRRRLGAAEEDGIPTQDGLSLRIDRIRNLEKDYVDDPVDLCTMRYRDVEVRTPDNQPASLALLDLQCYADEHFRQSGKRYFARTRISCDRRGRCRLLLPPSEFRMLVLTADAYGYQESTATDDGPPSPWRVDLTAMPMLKGRILDEKGRPVPGAWIFPTERKAMAIEGPLHEGHEGLTDASLQCMETRTDAEGRFVVRYLPIKNAVWTVSASREYLQGDVPRVQFRLPPEKVGRELELVLGKKP